MFERRQNKFKDKNLSLKKVVTYVFKKLSKLKAFCFNNKKIQIQINKISNFREPRIIRTHKNLVWCSSSKAINVSTYISSNYFYLHRLKTTLHNT